MAALRRLLTFGSRFVRSLHLQQLPSHLDLQILFDCMHRSAVRDPGPQVALDWVHLQDCMHMMTSSCLRRTPGYPQCLGSLRTAIGWSAVRRLRICLPCFW